MRYRIEITYDSDQHWDSENQDDVHNAILNMISYALPYMVDNVDIFIDTDEE